MHKNKNRKYCNQESHDALCHMKKEYGEKLNKCIKLHDGG